jgi:spore germination protein KB
MIENDKISALQLMMLVVLFNIGTTILIVPSSLAQEAKQDAWIASIVGLGIGLLFIPLYNALAKLSPNLTLFQLSEKILGKWLGKTISVLYFTFFFIICAFLVRIIGDFITTQIMPQTPIQAIIIIFLSIVIMGIRHGLEVFSRSSEILMPLVIFLLFIVVLTTAPQIDFKKIQPIFEADIKTLLRANVVHIGVLFLELIVFLTIFPYVNDPKKTGNVLLIGTLIGGIVTILITFLSISIIGAYHTAGIQYPTYMLAKKINIGEFLQRIEAVIAVIWFISIFFKMTICFYASVLGLAQTLNLKEYRSLTYPLGMITVVLSLVISPNIVYYEFFTAKIWTPYALTFGFFFPLLLLVVGILRKKVC